MIWHETGELADALPGRRSPFGGELLAMRRVPITSQGLPSTVAANPAVRPAEKWRAVLSGMPRSRYTCLAVS